MPPEVPSDASPLVKRLWQVIRAHPIMQGIRGSLSLRSAVIITVAGIVAIIGFGTVVSTQLRSNVFESRRDQILQDASVRFSGAQAIFDQSTATSADQVQEAVRQVVDSIRSSAAGAGAVSLVLLRKEGEQQGIRINEIADPDVRSLISVQLRTALTQTGSPQWQSIDIGITSLSDNDSEPGIIVGNLVRLPQAGMHELYVVYSLERDQAIVDMVMQVLLLASVPLLILLPFGAYWMIHQLMRPVRQTAAAAQKLAAGDLEARVVVEGADEMSNLSTAFNDMAASLQTQIKEYDNLSQLQQRFVSDVSHELRTPLTTIRMAEEMIWMEHHSLEPAGRRSAELLHDQVERFETMLADLLEISRFDAQSALLDPETTDLRTVVAKVVTAADEVAQRLNVPIQVQTPDERCSAEIDARRIERVLRNLVVNAIEHADGSIVTIDVAVNDSAVGIRVRDRGVGMTQEVAKRVFDRFYRADSARTRTIGGTGLGLSIAKEDVSLHGGRIEAFGKLGEGASFLVTLPRKLGTDVGVGPLELWEENPDG